jgi:hypothetical protein
MFGSSDDIENRANQYSTARGMGLELRLGFGKDGYVFSTSLRTAVKCHERRDSFEKELLCFKRLQAHGVDLICGHHVPRLLDSDNELMVIEMTIVTAPYLLDFAGAHLDNAPEFSPEVMEQWRLEKIEQFGDHWPDVENVLDLMKSRFGIHLLDVHPGNIAFGE